MNFPPRLIASWSSATTILWRVRPVPTSTRSEDIVPPRSRNARFRTRLPAPPKKKQGPSAPVDPSVRGTGIPAGAIGLHLAGFLVDDVLADDRVVLPQLEPFLAIVLVLLR